MLLVGESSKKFIDDYSNQFQRDFLQLLRTSHGEKKVHLNHFYQEYISNKTHVHQNATRWPSLTEFAKHLGREGICRVEENEKGIHISWIDNSPEALRRQDAIRKKERQDRGDEEREQMLIREQVRRAQMDAEQRGGDEHDEQERELKRADGEKIKLSFGTKPTTTKEGSSPTLPTSIDEQVDDKNSKNAPGHIKEADESNKSDIPPSTGIEGKTAPAKMSLKLNALNKPKNVFASAKKNALGGKKAISIEQPKKMSEAERIMKEEMERKRARESGIGGPAQKKQRF
ncbi:hypothetical protein B7463_g439, partial [Scytalidium lignicola]